jgi:hypothetical protein
MGMIGSTEVEKTPVNSKRKSGGLDFSSLKPLNPSSGVKNFAGYRDVGNGSPSGFPSLKQKKKKSEDEMDSDNEEDEEAKPAAEEDAEGEGNKDFLSPEDALRAERLTEGVRKIKVSLIYHLYFVYSKNIANRLNLSLNVNTPLSHSWTPLAPVLPPRRHKRILSMARRHRSHQLRLSKATPPIFRPLLPLQRSIPNPNLLSPRQTPLLALHLRSSVPAYQVLKTVSDVACSVR